MTLPKSVAICVPCYGGLIHYPTARSLMVATKALDDAGVHVEWLAVTHESLVQRARNLLVHMFLGSKCERMVFVDADITFAPDALLTLLDREEDIVGAAYPKKRLNWPAIKAAVERGEQHPQRYAADFVVNVVTPPGEETGEFVAPVRDGCLLEVQSLGTGFLSISRECLLKMAEAHPDTVYIADGAARAHEAMHALFDCAIVGGAYLSEDYYFCHRWREMGGQCWLHLGIPLGHIGVHTYTGDLHSVFQPVSAS